MSVEEDTELRDLLTQTLESNGSLAKIRAELRASIFLALDEHEVQKPPLLNAKIENHLNTLEGKMMFCLVREFLEFFSLDFTSSVYEPESYMGLHYHYESRGKIIENLAIPQLEENSDEPLILQVIRIAKLVGNKPTSTSESCENTIDTNPTRSEIIEDINQTFDVKSPRVCTEQFKQTNDVHVDNFEEISVNLIDLDKSDVTTVSRTESEKLLMDGETSAPVVKDVKHTKFDSFEKLKSPLQKTEKKSKSNSDLPPSPIGKPRNDMLLPSLYSKEFKERNNLKDIEKILDLDLDLDNYEEDFMSESEVDHLLNETDLQKTIQSDKKFEDENDNKDKSIVTSVDLNSSKSDILNSS